MKSANMFVDLLQLLTALIMVEFGMAQVQIVDKVCYIPVDIILAIDSSSSIGYNNFMKELQFAANLGNNFALGPENTRFGALVYGPSVQKLFDLNTFHANQEMGKAILDAPYMDTRSYPHQPFKFVQNDGMFESQRGGRNDVPDILILLTDGRSNRGTRSLQSANDLKSKNINIMTVGIGSNKYDKVLERLAGSLRNVFRITDFQNLDSIRDLLGRRICEVTANRPGTDTQAGIPTATRPGPSTQITNTTPHKPPTETTKGDWCVQIDLGCQNKVNGEYAACQPDCQKGIFVICTDGDTEVRECPLGTYMNGNGEDFTAKLVFNPMLRKCVAKTEYCKRPFDKFAVE